MNARRLKSAFTLLELMIVVGIIAALAALGISASTELLPRFKTRQAAYQFARQAELARQLAMTERKQVRILMVEYDNYATDPDQANKGLYRIQMGNRASGSTVWDTLPFESGSADTYLGEGTVDLSKGGLHYKKGVSIDNWGTLSGPGSGNADAIVFSNRGTVMNPSSDFDSNGNIPIVFVNKPSARKVSTDPETFVVNITRTGMIRVDSNRGSEYPEYVNGTRHTTTHDDSDGDPNTGS